MGDKINSFEELGVYQMAMEAAMEIFQITKSLPPEEKFSMVDQMRRSSRSACTNIAEACETQVWLEFANKCNYMDAVVQDELGLRRLFQCRATRLVALQPQH